VLYGRYGVKVDVDFDGDHLLGIPASIFGTSPSHSTLHCEGDRSEASRRIKRISATTQNQQGIYIRLNLPNLEAFERIPTQLPRGTTLVFFLSERLRHLDPRPGYLSIFGASSSTAATRICFPACVWPTGSSKQWRGTTLAALAKKTIEAQSSLTTSAKLSWKWLLDIRQFVRPSYTR
jgi:hypothetical protein